MVKVLPSRIFVQSMPCPPPAHDVDRDCKRKVRTSLPRNCSSPLISAKKHRIDAPSMNVQVCWYCPEKFILHQSWLVMEGGDSQEAQIQKQRENLIFETAYAMPSTPDRFVKPINAVSVLSSTPVPEIPLVSLFSDGEEDGKDEDEKGERIGASGAAASSGKFELTNDKKESSTINTAEACNCTDKKHARGVFESSIDKKVAVNAVRTGSKPISSENMRLQISSSKPSAPEILSNEKPNLEEFIASIISNVDAFSFDQANSIHDADPDIAVAIAAACMVAKALEGASLVDQELLVRILRNPSMLTSLTSTAHELMAEKSQAGQVVKVSDNSSRLTSLHSHRISDLTHTCNHTQMLNFPGSHIENPIESRGQHNQIQRKHDAMSHSLTLPSLHTARYMNGRPIELSERAITLPATDRRRFGVSHFSRVLCPEGESPAVKGPSQVGLLQGMGSSFMHTPSHYAASIPELSSLEPWQQKHLQTLYPKSWFNPQYSATLVPKSNFSRHG